MPCYLLNKTKYNKKNSDEIDLKTIPNQNDIFNSKENIKNIKSKHRGINWKGRNSSY